jgi:hypothetical protein
LLIFAVEIGENKRLLEIKEEYCEYIIYVWDEVGTAGLETNHAFFQPLEFSVILDCKASPRKKFYRCQGSLGNFLDSCTLNDSLHDWL